MLTKAGNDQLVYRTITQVVLLSYPALLFTCRIGIAVHQAQNTGSIPNSRNEEKKNTATSSLAKNTTSLYADVIVCVV